MRHIVVETSDGTLHAIGRAPSLIINHLEEDLPGVIVYKAQYAAVLEAIARSNHPSLGGHA